MNPTDNRDLDSLLACVQPPAAPPGLAARVTQAALSHRQSPRLATQWRELRTRLLARPAQDNVVRLPLKRWGKLFPTSLAAACAVVIIGVAVHMNAPVNAPIEISAEENFDEDHLDAIYLMEEEDFIES